MFHRPASWQPFTGRTRHLAIGVAAVPLLCGALSSAQPALASDSGVAGCAALSGTHQVAAADYPTIRAQFAGSRSPDLRISGLAYVEIATKLLTTHAYGGETTWFYQRLATDCARHGRPLPFWPG
jgi:hypothetical protein